MSGLRVKKPVRFRKGLSRNPGSLRTLKAVVPPPFSLSQDKVFKMMPPGTGKRSRIQFKTIGPFRG